MNISDCFYLGYVSKTIGSIGELTFKLDVDSPSFYQNLDLVFVQINSDDQYLVPFYLKSATLHKENLLRCIIDDIESKAAAKKIVGKSLYLPSNQLEKLNENQFYFHEIIGYEVLDREKGNIGQVIDILDTPHTHLLSIEFKGIEILVPINEQTIIEVDKKNKTLHIQAADGLIDLYLET